MYPRIVANAKAWEEKERQKEAEQEFYREQARRSNERQTQGGSLSFSEGESQIFRQLWKIGYRTLSMQFHPDKGGNIEQMKMLNGIKDKFGSMLK